MAKDKSEKKEKKEKKSKGDEPAVEAEDVEMADVSEVSACTFPNVLMYTSLLVPKKTEEGERDHHSARRFVSSCATISTEKAREEVTQNDQKGCVYSFYLFIHWFTVPQPLRRDR